VKPTKWHEFIYAKRLQRLWSAHRQNESVTAIVAPCSCDVRSPHVGTGRRQSSGRDIVAKPSLHIRNGANFNHDHDHVDTTNNNNDCAHYYNYDGATYYYDLNHSNLDDNDDDNDNDNDNDGESTDYYDDS
jgi:hypothetical protein